MFLLDSEASVSTKTIEESQAMDEKILATVKVQTFNNSTYSCFYNYDIDLLAVLG